MNRHFSDARYYFGRAASHLTIGLREELSPVVGRVRSRLGYEVETGEPETRTEWIHGVATRSKGRVVAGARRARQRVGRTRADDEVTI